MHAPLPQQMLNESKGVSAAQVAGGLRPHGRKETAGQRTHGAAFQRNHAKIIMTTPEYWGNICIEWGNIVCG